MTMPAQAELQLIPPHPVPTMHYVQTAQTEDGTPLVILTTSTPIGQTIDFMSRDQAIELASMIRKAAQTGPQLLKPPTGLLIPHG